MKREKYLTIMLIMSFISYFMMTNLSMMAEAGVSKNSVTITAVKTESVAYDLRDYYIKEKNLVKYIADLTELTLDESDFIVRESKENEIDPFIILGIIKRESDFNPYAVGEAGERGLGQLMENTARPVAENLGYIYKPDKLFDSRYNLKLTITQISYLSNIYNGDIHKVLTAYNMGQQGLDEYINKGVSPYEKPAMSDYSVKVLNLASEYKEEFDNFKY